MEKQERIKEKKADEIKGLMVALKNEFRESEINELLEISLPSTHLMKFNILYEDAPSIHDEEMIECRLCKKIFKTENGFDRHITAHIKNHFYYMAGIIRNAAAAVKKSATKIPEEIQVGETLNNGCRILEVKPLYRNGSQTSEGVVLTFWGVRKEFVTWKCNLKTRSMYSGNYFKSVVAAVKDFEARK